LGVCLEALFLGEYAIEPCLGRLLFGMIPSPNGYWRAHSLLLTPVLKSVEVSTFDRDTVFLTQNIAGVRK
jgi:hypothetical protein